MTAPREPAEEVLAEILRPDPPPFALLHRPQVTGPAVLDVLVGEMEHHERLDDLPETPDETLVLVPFRQILERGLEATDDGAPLRAMRVTRRATLPRHVVLDRLPDVVTSLVGGRFDPSDEQYAAAVERVIAEEIGRGEGSNFVLRRSFLAEIPDYSVASALTLFGRLLQNEVGAYWTFVVHCGDRTFVGASPELHVTLAEGVVTMNPISGTHRYPAAGPSLDDVMTFLGDRKEAEELTMVVDEELKMMARICERGGRATGPYYREMTRLAHTEYLLQGRSALDPRAILRETLFAPTVTGSPLESACRMIRRHEARGRGYYAGAMALIGTDEHGDARMDSAILIRTADIDAAGRVDIGVGATIVRHSQPASEVVETQAKADALRLALEASPRPRFGRHPDVRAALAGRNDHLADFWLHGAGDRPLAGDGLAGRRVCIVDAEDTFTAMLAHQLEALGMSVSCVRYDRTGDLGGDLVVMGPGPGDPCDDRDPKIARLAGTMDTLLSTATPVLAVCLSHQVLCRRLGLPVRRLPAPNQGMQREIDLFGTRRRVGFYNTFAARWGADLLPGDELGAVDVCRDPATGEVHALRGAGLASMQFHPESVLTRDGPEILAGALQGLLREGDLVGADRDAESPGGW